MNNITLIGMPGAGKSTVGIVLAKVLGYDFIDTDLLIQKEENRLLWQIMRDEGIDGFNAIEERVNSQIDVTHSVIATGGSVIYGPKAMEHLAQHQHRCLSEGKLSNAPKAPRRFKQTRRRPKIRTDSARPLQGACAAL